MAIVIQARAENNSVEIKTCHFFKRTSTTNSKTARTSGCHSPMLFQERSIFYLPLLGFWKPVWVCEKSLLKSALVLQFSSNYGLFKAQVHSNLLLQCWWIIKMSRHSVQWLVHNDAGHSGCRRSGVSMLVHWYTCETVIIHTVSDDS